MPILDVLVTNLHRGYDQAVIRQLIQPHVPCQGVVSDHFVALAFPNKDLSHMTGFSRKETRQRRNVTTSNLIGLTFFFACFDWRALHSLAGADAKLQYFENVAFPAQDFYCPMESFVVRLNASFPVSAKVAMLSTQKASEFCKHRYSQRFKDLRKLDKVEKKRKIDEAMAEVEGSNSWLSW